MTLDLFDLNMLFNDKNNQLSFFFDRQIKEKNDRITFFMNALLHNNVKPCRKKNVGKKANKCREYIYQRNYDVILANKPNFKTNY